MDTLNCHDTVISTEEKECSEDQKNLEISIVAGEGAEVGEDAEEDGMKEVDLNSDPARRSVRNRAQRHKVIFFHWCHNVD